MKTVMAAFLLMDMIIMSYSTDVFSFNSTLVNVSAEDEWIQQVVENPFGNCTAKEVWEIHTTCFSPFINAIQKKKQCMPLVETFVNCRMDLYNKSQCFKLDDIGGFISDAFNGIAEVMCEKAGLYEQPIYQFEKVKGGNRIFLPCSISNKEYVKELKKCNHNMLEIWKNNTADPRVCREYFNTKQCKKRLIDTKCNYTGETKTSIDLLFGNYNPFCPDGVDFTSGSQFPKPFGVTMVVMFLLILIVQL